jgi:uncharacterized ferritin-like protein (DUF455 family)
VTTIASACRSVLLAAAPRAKIKAARAAWRAWRRGALAHDFDVFMPDRPARPVRPELLPPNRMPKRGKAGSERSRIAMLHALAHIEYGAIDLAFDMAGRFGASFPRAFVDDWLSVGADEAIHFALLDRRLAALGAGYGALPAHDGLWEAAAATARSARPPRRGADGAGGARARPDAGARGGVRARRRLPLGRRPDPHLSRRDPARRGGHVLVQA